MPAITTTDEEGVPSTTPLADLMQTRMLPGEDPKAFERLCARVFADAKPRDAFEELLVLDYLHYAWEALRLRRYKDNLLQVRAPDGLVPVLTPLLGGDEDRAQAVTAGWSSGAPRRVRAGENYLAKAGLTMDARMAETLAINLDDVERLDYLLEPAEARRASALRELAHHRETLATGTRLLRAARPVPAQGRHARPRRGACPATSPAIAKVW
jgi:hypothetical protein